MSDYVSPEQVGTISLGSFKRYLLASGWRERRLKPGFAIPQPLLFTKKDRNSAFVQLPLPLGVNSPDYQERLRDAIQTLVDMEGRTAQRITESIQQVGYDVVFSTIPSSLVQDESISLASASAYVGGMQELLASSATTEVQRLPFFARQLKEGLSFAKTCRFGHTYKGSFGFVLESPLPLAVTEPLFPDIPTVSFERRVVQRLARGIRIVDQSVRDNSTAQLIEGYRTGLNANGCEDLADLVANVSPGGLVFAFRLSPEGSADDEVDGARFEIGPAHVEVCRAAARELRRNDVAIPARVAGPVVRLQNDSDPTDFNERTGAHEVFILWFSQDFGDIRVKINLTPPEYLEAVRAHASGRPVSVSGVLSKYGRQWVLQEPKEFAVSEQRELPT